MTASGNPNERDFSIHAFLSKVGAGKATVPYSTKEVLFSQGDAADAIFYVHKGIIKLTVISSRGKEAVIAILGAGGFFGEGCLGGQVKRMSTATAMSLASVTRIEKAAVSRVLDDEPAFMELFLNWALSATTATSKFIVRCGMSFCTTEFRPEPRRRSAPVAVIHAPRFCQQNQCLARQM